jgi:hypothetical protein
MRTVPNDHDAIVIPFPTRPAHAGAVVIPFPTPPVDDETDPDPASPAGGVVLELLVAA